MAAGFAARGGRSVTLIEGPASTDLRESLYTASLLAKDDTFDLVLMDVTWPAKFAAAGWLLPLDPWFDASAAANFLPQALDAGRYRGTLYRVPTRTDVGVLYHRKDWLAEGGLSAPRTFSELAAVARALQAPPRRWGFVWPGSQYEGLVCFYLEVLRGFGGGWITGDGQDTRLDQPPAAAALEWLRVARLVEPISPPGVTTYKEEESRRLFQDGRSVFLRNWPYAWRLSQASGSPLQGRVGMTSLPSATGAAGAGTLGGWGLGIARYSRQPDLAADFIRHATSLDGQRLMCERSGYVPATRAGLADAQLLAANPLLRELGAIHAAAVARPPLPRYALLSDILQRGLSAALSGLEQPADALRAAAEETRRVLAAARTDA